MGLGDYIFWTATIRDISKHLESLETTKKKLRYLVKIKSLGDDDIGLLSVNFSNENLPFKFFPCCSWKNNDRLVKFTEYPHANIIFENNDYITSDESYPNLIYLKIISNFYWNENNNGITDFSVKDDKHWIKILADKFKLKNYSLYGDFTFTREEINKVIKYLPKEEFILINYQGKIESRSYSKSNMQKVVNYLSKKIKCVQIIPNSFQREKYHKLDNVLCIQGELSFREALCFSSYAKYAILTHGGLSNGIACFQIKTICLYSNLFNPIATKTDSEIPYIYCDHGDFCYKLDCQKCLKNTQKNDETELINLVQEHFKL